MSSTTAQWLDIRYQQVITIEPSQPVWLLGPVPPQWDRHMQLALKL